MSTNLTPVEEDRMRQTAELLLEARRTLVPIAALPVELRPQSLAEAFAVQDVIAEALGAIGGWKIGRPAVGESPVFAPMPVLGGFSVGGATVAGTMSRVRGVEAEMAFLLGSDLPPRAVPYSREEVVEAIGGCHPAIEILETAFEDTDKVDALSLIADLLMNGGFVYGDACPNWQAVDLGAEMASMSIDGALRIECHAPKDFDPLGLLTWLANEGQTRTGGLHRGDWITTGTWTGKVAANAGSEAIARFSTMGEVRVYFE